MHPLYDRLLARFCEETGLDAQALREMAAGMRPARPHIIELTANLLDVPRSAWPKKVKATAPGVGIVSPRVSGHHAGVTREQHAQILRENSRKRRRYLTPVHAVLDLLDWTVADLAERVSVELGKPVSRSSMQFWATGTRQVGPKGKSRAHPVQAPLDVRQIAEMITAREARKRGLGDQAILRALAWPNVEDA